MTQMPIPRPEYPRPQLVRSQWQNLNGPWQFAFDPGNSGRERKWFRDEHSLPLQIQVPFCPESRLSGLGETDFVAAVWYRRSFTLPSELKGQRVILHFGAVDYQCEVWINQQPVGRHQGGYSSFSFDITRLVHDGDNTLTVYAADDVRSGRQPAGKQSSRYHSYSCSYTRTTGIWQTVWLELVGNDYIEQLGIRADWANRQVLLTPQICRHSDKPLTLTARLEDPENGDILASGQIRAQAGSQSLMLTPEPAAAAALRPWQPGQAVLYDLDLSLTDADGKLIDHVRSYCGFRDLELRAAGLYINGEPVFQRLILDQGFYPEGIYTAPDDAALRQDIELAMSLGFNGARLHQKVFEPRFLYWADRLGYLVWGEHASWELDHSQPEALMYFLPEWLEIVRRDLSHPAIIGWCPFNETWDIKGRKQCDAVIEQTYLVTKAIDPSRPVIDTSGNYHVRTDLFDIHDYEQDVRRFAEKFDPMQDGASAYVTYPDRQRYEGQPYFVSEYGGAWWSPGQEGGWGYGQQPHSEAEFLERYRGLTEVLLRNEKICAFCYTQLTNVEQEQNGLYTYDRQMKFSAETYEAIRRINSQPAAFEKIR
ncbi:MAG: beta-galactosidase [Clostridia bacterium]|nr:beta-galactosidase [Clostridia bacterium]